LRFVVGSSIGADFDVAHDCGEWTAELVCSVCDPVFIVLDTVASALKKLVNGDCESIDFIVVPGLSDPTVLLDFDGVGFFGEFSQWQ
jgi:hypothetical protein